MKIVLRRAYEISKFELPISALIIDEKGRCIGRGTNKRQKNKDPLGHAELIALRQAAWIKNDWRFNECILIVNLEPCTMCAAALVQSRMGKVIYSTGDSKRGGFGGSIDLSTHISAHHKMEIISGIYEEDSKKLLKDWFKKLRKER
ncbi:MAG: tRNA-specific adenosine deaminase [Prochlorococcus sp. SP3034]|nr:tRNA-specific adenosine deaminase [Prochlorococcus sp. SP3034]